MRRLLWLLAVALLAAPARAQAPAFLIERIEIEGAERVSPGVIESESRLFAGRSYSEEQLAAANDRLRRLPFLLDATFALQKGSERDRYVLVISVKATKPLFYSFSTVIYSRSSNNLLIESPNDAVIGARFFAGPRTAFHFGFFARDSNRPITKNYAVFQGGITRYDVFGTGALVTLAVNQILAPTTSGRFLPEAVVALPLSSKQTVTGSFTARKIGNERERIFESRWSYNTTNDPFFPTRGTLLSTGPVVSTIDAIRRERLQEFLVHSRAIAGELEAKRYWELSPLYTAGGEALLGIATVDQRRDGVPSDFTQGYGRAIVQVSRALSTNRASMSRLELTLRTVSNGTDRVHSVEDGVTELAVNWARRDAWGSLRFGVGYAW